MIDFIITNDMKGIPLLLMSAIFSLFPVHSIHAEVKQIEGTSPNILLIIIDDMGWKDIGCAGSIYYETPNIDQLA